MPEVQNEKEINPELLSVYEDIRDRMLKIGFKQPFLVYNREHIDAATPEQTQEAIKWLKLFRDGYLKVYDNARALVSEARWQFYANTGVTGTYEQERLNTAFVGLREAWRNRPWPLNKKSQSGLPKGSRKNSSAVRKARLMNMIKGASASTTETESSSNQS